MKIKRIVSLAMLFLVASLGYSIAQGQMRNPALEKPTQELTSKTSVLTTTPSGMSIHKSATPGAINIKGRESLRSEADKTPAGISWIKQVNNSGTYSFVKNIGQFDQIDGLAAKDILYSLRDKNMKVYFTTRGLVYSLEKRERVSDEEWEKFAEDHNIVGKEEGREEGEKSHFIPKVSFVKMTWEGANMHAEIKADNQLDNYFSYYNPEKDKDKILGPAFGFKTLTYKNIYPNIDIEYAVHPDGGIKYNIILHPGADAGQLKMLYSGTDIVLDANKNVNLPTFLGTITDHAPVSYGGTNSAGEKIESSFFLAGKNTIGFRLPTNLITTTTTIDPWVVGPPIAVNECAADIATDGSSNVFVYSIDTLSASGSYICKYTAAGAPVWTFNVITNTGYNVYDQGDVGADASGNVYVTMGLGIVAGAYYNTIKINPTGTGLLWGSGAAGGSTKKLYESWSISFSCDKSQLIQSGGGIYNGCGGGNTSFNVSTYETLNTATGLEGAIHEDDKLGEIISSFWAPNNMMYHITADSNLGGVRCPPGFPTVSGGNHNYLICDNPSAGFARVFRVPTTYHYTDGQSKAAASVGMNSIATSCSFLYTTDGLSLDKWDLLTGQHYASTAIPGGSNNAPALKVNGGIVCDKCGNVYVGGNTKIFVYDGNLNLTNTITGLPDVVIDMVWGKNGQLYACGGTQPSRSFVTSVAIPTCSFGSSGLNLALTQPTCGTPSGSATATVSFCGAPYLYSWSSGQTVQTVSNLAAGNYTVVVSGSINCPFTYSDTATFTVNPPASSVTGSATPTSVTCNATCNGTATASGSGGTPGYTYAWTGGTIGGGAATATATGLCAGPTYTCTITDASGCPGQITTVIPGPTAIAANPTQTAVSCSGLSDGTATVAPVGGSPGYIYTWTGGSIVGSTVTATAAGLVSGTVYTCTITDNNLCSTTQTFTITSPTILTASSTPTNPSCGGGNNGSDIIASTGGNGGFTYAWTTVNGTIGAGANAASATSLSAGSYTCVVTDSKGCTASITDNLASAGSPVVTLGVTTGPQCSNSCNGSAALNVTGGTVPYVFSWNSVPSQSGSTAVGLCGGSYICTVTDNNNCVTTQAVTLATPAVLTFTQTVTNNSCNNSNNGNVCVTPSGGTPGYTYSWTPNPGTGQSTSCAGGLGAGPITCIITDLNGCADTTVFNITQPSLLTASAAQTNATCQKNNGTIQVTPTGGTAGFTYNWNPASVSGANPTAVLAGIYTCTIQDANGCSAIVIDTILNIGVPPVSAILHTTPTTFCLGDSILLTASGAGAGGTYSWSTGSTADSLYLHQNGSVTLYALNSCGLDSTKTILTVYTVPNPTVTGSPNICPGDSSDLVAQSTPVTVPPTTFVWNPGNHAGSSFWASSAGTYSVTATNMCGVTSSSPVTIAVYNIQADFSASTYVGNNPLPVIFTDSSTSTAITWHWNFGDGSTSTTQNPTHTYTAAGTYVVIETVTDVNGCTSIFKHTIVISDLPSWITIPNVFTPNGDDKNDNWQVSYQGISEFDCKIYDRWGVMMAELKAPGATWDGRTIAGLPAVSGTYYYILGAQGDDGKSYSFKGFLMLMRD
jgi:gliding motility-associated-like protein